MKEISSWRKYISTAIQYTGPGLFPLTPHPKPPYSRLPLLSGKRVTVVWSSRKLHDTGSMSLHRTRIAAPAFCLYTINSTVLLFFIWFNFPKILWISTWSSRIIFFFFVALATNKMSDSQARMRTLCRLPYSLPWLSTQRTALPGSPQPPGKYLIKIY